MENSTKTSVIYNANCPLCNFETQHYARYAGQAGLPIEFDDLNSDARTHWGLDADTAAKRLYVLHQGTLSEFAVPLHGISSWLGSWAGRACFILSAGSMTMFWSL